jgi:hypothetical protein
MYYIVNPDWRPSDPRWVTTAFASAEVRNWCINYGAVVGIPISANTKMKIEQAYIHFFDEEMYTMFKLRWG